MSKTLLTTLFVMMLPCSAIAKIQADLSGFATLGISYNDNDQVGFSPNSLNNTHTNWSVLSDSKFGLQLNLGITSQWDSVLQVVAQDRSNTTFENFVELAFVRFRPSRNWSLRAGRLNSDLYFLSEYLSVSNAYLWQRPPQEFYAFTSTIGNFDGIDIEFSDNINNGFFRMKMATGTSTPKLESDGIQSEIEFDNLVTVSAQYQRGNYTFRGAHTRADVAAYRAVGFSEFIVGLNSLPEIFWPAASNIASGIEAKSKVTKYSALGISFENDQWIIQSELGLSSSDWLIAPSTLTGYVSLGYRLNNLTIFGTLTGAKQTEEQVDLGTLFIPEELAEPLRNQILQLNVAAISTVRGSAIHQNSLSIGAKWYATDKITLKVQIDRFKVHPFGGVLWEYNVPAQAGIEQHINLFSVSASTVF